MKTMASRLVVAVVSTVVAAPSANATPDTDSFLRHRGWERCGYKRVTTSPDPDVNAICYYEKGNSAPSCGLLSNAPGGRTPNFIELVGSDAGVGYPQCMGITFMVPFILQSKQYIAVEYQARETREDFYRAFYYIYKDSAKGYVEDKLLNRSTPSILGSVGPDIPDPSTEMDGVKFARMASVAATFPQWRLLKNHFISGQKSSFAIFDDINASRCYLVVEAGARPIAMSHDTFAPAAKCVSVLATGHLEKAETTYYLAMFKSNETAIRLAIASVDLNGKIKAESDLSDRINRPQSPTSIKGAKVMLSTLLQ